MRRAPRLARRAPRLVRLCLAIAAIVRTAAFSPLSGESAPSLASAQRFAVLAAAGVASAGNTTLTGDLGVSPETSVSGFPPGVVAGSIHAGDAVAAQARRDASMASAALAALECPAANDLSGQDLGGLILPPGVYCFDASAGLMGSLTLDGEGPWVFQIARTLTAAERSSVASSRSDSGCPNLFWQVGGNATLAPGSRFAGNLLATGDIALGAGATLSGSAMALTGAVTLETSRISICSAPDGVFPPAARAGTGGSR